jgi:hypothetical protein
VAYRLSLHSIKSFQNLNKQIKVFSAPLHLEAWHNYTLSALGACKGRPTVIFPSTMLSSRATVEIALSVLYEQLSAAGGWWALGRARFLPSPVCCSQGSPQPGA